MSKKVLVVDDEENIVELITINLENSGYEVVSASDGTTGLVKALASHYDLIILDVRMPGIDGFSVCKNIKNNPKTKDIPVIFLTAATQKKDYETAKVSDCDYYFPKPFDPEELVKIVDSILKG
ncbi:response regulator transcription factor [Elusimicrobiota bacterium]